MKNFIIIIEGPMGSGKTTIGSLIHPKLKRTALLGTDKIKWFLSDFDRTPEDNGLMANVLYAMARSFLEQKCNLLIPQGFWKKEYIERFAALASEFGTELLVYQLEAPEPELLERIKNRAENPETKRVLTDERITSNIEKWKNNRYAMGTVIDTGKYSAEDAAALILKDVTSL